MDHCTLACCADGGTLSNHAAGELAAGFKALGDPHRVAVVDLLLRAGEPVCVVDIERHLPLAQSTVSYHLKTLIDARILERERRGRWMYYTVRPAGLDLLRGALAGFLSVTSLKT